MKNPWVDLKEDENHEYILDIDRDTINKIRKDLTDDYELHLDLYPAPFDGDPNAPIYLLNLNPGYSENDKKEMPIIKDYVFKNLKHQNTEYPFCPLNPELDETGGNKWWKETMGPLLRDVKNDQLVSKNIFCIEYFPYHSRKYNLNINVPSQEYNLYLIKKAIENNCLIIIMRKEKELFELIPELSIHKNNNLVFSCINKQRPWISKDNIEDNGYNEILKKLGIEPK